VNRVPGRLARLSRSPRRKGHRLQLGAYAGPIPALDSLSRPRCSRLHAGLPVRRSGFDSRWALTTHAWPIGMRHRPSKPARRVRFPPRALSVFCRVGWRPSRPHKPDPVGSIPTPATGKRPHRVALVKRAPQGPTLRSAPDSKPAAVEMGRGQQPLEQHLSKARWQTARRTSASRRSPGRVTAERCLSSVDGDVPGPYPGEDRSSRSRGSR
jgi:hypothetical protein